MFVGQILACKYRYDVNVILIGRAKTVAILKYRHRLVTLFNDLQPKLSNWCLRGCRIDIFRSRQIVKLRLMDMESERRWFRFTRLSRIIKKNLQTWPLNQTVKWILMQIPDLLSEFEDNWWSQIVQQGKKILNQFPNSLLDVILRSLVIDLPSVYREGLSELLPGRNSRAHSSDPAREGDSGGQLKAANYQPAIFLLMQLC